MADETAVAKAVASLSRNTNATGLLTRMVVQQEQVDRLLKQYGEAMGPEAADEARFKDPFVGWAGMVESLRNLSAAVGEDVMPTIVQGLNALSGGINSLQGAWRDGDPLAKAGILGGAAGASFGAWKVASAIWGLMTAGTNLNLAAASLQAAAVSLGGAGVADAAAGGAAKKRGWLGALGALSGTAGVIIGSGLIQSGSAREMTPEEKAKVLADGERQWSVIEERRRIEAEARAAAQQRYDVNEAKTTDGFNAFHGIVGDAQKTGQDVKDALSVTAKPTVDKSDLQATLNLINQIKAGLSGLGASIAAAHAQVQREMNRNFADHGVAP